MSRDFKLNLRSLSGKEETPEPPTPVEAEPPAVDKGEDMLYPTPGNARTLDIVWPDGRRMALNYAYLVSSELKAEGDGEMILLTFTSSQVQIKGYNLVEMYNLIVGQEVKSVEVVDARYRDLSDTRKSFIAEVAVSS